MAQDVLVLSDLTADRDEFKTQIQAYLSTQTAWKGSLTTMTSTTLVDINAAIGAFAQSRLIRAYEDAFAETAQSDDAIRSITQMQGLRMTRKAPAMITATLTSDTDETIAPYTQFVTSGQYYFNRVQLPLTANVPSTVELWQGQLEVFNVIMDGTEFQAFQSDEAGFVVSDTDTVVRVNGKIIEKAGGGLWNYRGIDAFSDLTSADGKLMIIFGNETFGSIPQKNDVVLILYAITQGAAGNNQSLLDKSISVDGFGSISGVVTSDPTGGSDEKPITVYKNVASGSFGTYLSGVTRSQYLSLVSTYPGIVDAVTQAQREINPMDVRWMNAIRVSAITNSPWTQAQQETFLDAMEKITMYACKFYWVDPVPIDRDVQIEVYCYNTAVLSQVKSLSEDAMTDFFAAKPGILMTDFFESDLVSVIKVANQGQVSHVVVTSPDYSMIVCPPTAVVPQWAVISGAGSLGPGTYGYSVAVETSEELGPPNKWVFPLVKGSASDNGVTLTWKTVPNAIKYHIYGRTSAQGYGAITVLNATATDTMTWTDNGSIVPVGPLPPSYSQAPIKYNRLSNLQIDVFYAERQQRMNGTPERTVT